MIFVRVKPDQRPSEVLHSHTRNSLTVTEKCPNHETKSEYQVSHVFAPDIKQPKLNQYYKTVFEVFTNTPGRNVMCLAYGKANTGLKTTVYGPPQAGLNAWTTED